MKKTEARRLAKKFKLAANEHRIRGRVDEAEKWDEAAKSADEIIKRQSVRKGHRDAEHMRKMRAARNR